MYMRINNLFLSPPEVDFCFSWFLVIKSVHWNCMGLYSRRRRLICGLFESFFSDQVPGMSENMEGPENNILKFLVGATMVGAIGKVWVLVLKMKFNDFYKGIFALPNVEGMTPVPPPLVGGTCLLIYSILIFFIFCANIIAKLITKGKALAVVQN